MSRSGYVDQLPEPAELRRRCHAWAMLGMLAAGRAETARCADVTFQPQWRRGGDLAKWQDGCGGEWSILFSPDGCLLRAFDAKSEINRYNERDLWPGIVDGLPEPFLWALEEAEFYDWFDGVQRVTACVWRAVGDDAWRYGDTAPVLLRGNEYVPGEGGEQCYSGDMGLFWKVLHWSADEVLESLAAPEGHGISVHAVERVMRFEPLTDELIGAFHPEPDLLWICGEAERIGYPVSDEARGGR